MKIEYVTGDLYTAPEIFTVQGCNAQGAMGSGVAKLWRDHDEGIFTAYRAQYDKHGLKVGDVVPVWTVHPVTKHPDGLLIFNAITQEFYGREAGRVYVSYDGLKEAFIKINQMFETYTKDAEISDVPRVSLPLIGAGLAQGKWAIISDIIEETSTNFQPVVYLQDGVIPK